MAEPLLLEVDRLGKRFPVAGRRGALLHAVDDVSLQIRSGESLGLVGESGCGKSTLVRLLARLLDPSEGRIVFDGVDLAALPARGFARHVAGTGGELPRRRAAQHGRTTGQHHAFIAVSDAAAQPLQPRAGCQCEALRGQPQGKMFQIGHALRTMMQRRAGSSPPAAACAGNPASHSGKAGSCAATSAKPCRA